jgi:glycosyltransferase involved in cell wall biosynthesis
VTPPNEGRTRPVIVHATEAMGGGVQSAIAAYTGLLDDYEHVVLGRPRDAEATHAFGSNVSVRTTAGRLDQYLRWIRRMIIDIDPDVVHIHSSLAGAARLIIPRRYRTIYSPHCFSFERRDIGSTKRAAYRIAETVFAQRTSAFVAVSPHEESLCRRLNPRALSVFVPNVVESDDLGETPRRTDTVVMTGRIGPQKDPALFESIARQVASDVEFVWVGDGDDRERERLRASGVNVTGWLSPREVARTVREAALYVHTGAWEASPIASMEAAAAGTPVIARDIPTMRSLGYVTSGPDAATLASSVDRFFADDIFAADVRQRSAAVAHAFSAGDARRRLLQAYGLGASATTHVDARPRP